jgi:LCP family protein required for cell wall assembly
MQTTDRVTPGIATLLSDQPLDPRRATHRWWRVLLAFATCLVVLLAGVFGAVLYVEHRLTAQVDRIHGAFDGLSHRPVKPDVGTAQAATNILLLGTDRRSDEQTTGTAARAPSWLPGLQRSDTIMLVHVSGDRRNVTVVSIPRDAWVPIPGHGHAKVNAAFSWGGPALTVQTVEQLTHVRIDHLAVVDWDGFRRITDALGGVTVDIPRTVYDSARGKLWTNGRHRLDGKAALLYVRQRHGLPGGDLDRIDRQQNLLRLLLTQVLRQQLWADPLQRYRILDAVTSNLSVDAGWTTARMKHLAHQLADLSTRDFYYTTVPVAGTGRVDGQDVVFLDGLQGQSLWRSVNEDRATGWFTAHPGSRLPSAVG